MTVQNYPLHSGKADPASGISVALRTALHLSDGKLL